MNRFQNAKSFLLGANLVAVLFCLFSFCPAPARAADVEQSAIAPQHCYTRGDVGFCFVHLYEVDAYSDFTGAIANFRILTPEQQRSAFLLTTNDQTRRALVVYRRLAGERPHPRGKDGFVAELFVTVGEARSRYELLDDDQKAGAFILTPTGGMHEALLVYRTFGKGGAQ